MYSSSDRYAVTLLWKDAGVEGEVTERAWAEGRMGLMALEGSVVNAPGFMALDVGAGRRGERSANPF